MQILLREHQTGKDAGQTTTASRKRHLPEAESRDHLKNHKISEGKRCKISTIQLAEDLLYEIFLMLPVKSLIRFRCVSKGMRAMIDSSLFIKNHNNHRCESERSLSDDYAIILQQFSRLLSVNFYKDNVNSAEVKELSFSLTKQGIMFPIGCCNGIFCFEKMKPESYYVLWNPSNGTFQKVECPESETADITYDSIGYDYVNDDYKIARARSDKSLQVYSLRKHSWTTFNGILPLCLFPMSFTEGVCVSGVMHWLPINPMFIAAFDFATEASKSLPLPQEATQVQLKAISLKDFGGRLCLTFRPYVDAGAAYSVWVMEKYGVERSWTKLYNINTVEFYYFPHQEKRLLCDYRQWLSWWDPQDGSYERIEFPTWLDQRRLTLVHIYVRNLVRLDQSLI